MGYNTRQLKASPDPKAPAKPKDVIVDPKGQWKHPGKVTKIPGDTMATHGYGDIPLWVVPDVGPPRMVQPNTGIQVFPGANSFTEYPQLKGWLDTMQDGGTKPWGEMTPKERAAYLDAKDANKKAETKSRAQAKKEHINDYIINSTKEALTHPLFSAPAYFTPQGAMIGAGQAAINASKNIYEGNYKTAAFDALGVLPLLKQLKNIPKNIKPTIKGKFEGVGSADDIKQLSAKPTYENNPYIFRDPHNNQPIYQTDPADFQNFKNTEMINEAKTHYKKASNDWLNTEGIKRSGNTDVPEFNKELNTISTQMQFGKRDLLTKDQFYTNDDVTKMAEQYKDYYKRLNDFEELNPRNQGNMIMQALSGQGDEYMKTFHNLNPQAKLPDWTGKFIGDYPLSKEIFNSIPGLYHKPLSLRTLKRLTQGEDKLLNKAKDIKSFEENYWGDMNPRGFVQEMRNSAGLTRDQAKNLTEEEAKKIADQIKQKLYNQSVKWYKEDIAKPYTGSEAFQDIQPNKFGGELDDEEFRRGGQKGLKKFTSKNIATSVNDIMMRNETLFGKPGKKRYKPGLKFQDGGEGTLNENQKFLTNMANSPLFNERYAKMTGNTDLTEATAYKNNIIDNINTVKYITDPKLLDKRDAEGMYAPKTHSIYKKNIPDDVTDLHEISHSSTKGKLAFKNPYTYSPSYFDNMFGDVKYKVDDDGYKLLKENFQNIYSKKKTGKYLSEPTELKSRVDVGRKLLNDSGLYDPINNRFEEKDYENLKRFTQDSNIVDLLHNYSKEDVIRMFNEIVANNPKAQPVAKIGGWLDNIV